MKKFLKNLYQKLQNTKIHLWSHIMALIGWIALLCLINDDFDMVILYSFIISIFECILFLVIFFLENVILRKKIIISFLNQNVYHNFLYFVGIISSIVPIIITNCYIIWILFEYSKGYFKPIIYKFLSTIILG